MLRTLPLDARAVAAPPGTDNLLVLTFSDADGTALHAVDPAAGTVSRTLVLPGEPGMMAVSDDGSTVYIGRVDRGSVVQVDLGAWAIVRDVTLPDEGGATVLPRRIAVVPGQPDVFVASLRRVNRSPSYGGIAVYDRGVRRPDSVPGHSGPEVGGFPAGPGLLHGVWDRAVHLIHVDEDGARRGEFYYAFENAGPRQIVHTDGLIVSEKGSVVRVEGYESLGWLGLPDATEVWGIIRGVVPSATGDRAFFLGEDGVLYSFWLGDMASAGVVDLGVELGLPPYDPVSMVRWGDRGVAVAAEAGLVLVESPLLSDAYATLDAVASVDFGRTDAPVTRDVWIRNPGTEPVTVDEVRTGGDFVAVEAPSSISARDSARVVVEFAPGRAGPASGSLAVATAQEGVATSDIRVVLEAESTVPSIDRPWPTLYFDATEVDSTSGVRLPLVNRSDSDVALGLDFVLGDDFGIPYGVALTVPAGEVVYVDVSFAPTRPGTLRDTLLVRTEGTTIVDTVAVRGTGIASTAAEDAAAAPLTIGPISPHPVTSDARVGYVVDRPGHVRLEVFDAAGRRVGLLVDRDHAPGAYTVALSAGPWPPALYVVRLTAAGRSVSRLLVLAR